MVSVIVCTYNQEKLIGRCLDAILAQQCDEPFEVIVGEDCSSDDTLSVCQKYAERFPDKVKLIANPSNLGIVDNYYNCFRQAQGEYYMDCGGDDEWCPGRMQLCLDIMRKHPEVSMVYSDFWQRYDQTGLICPSAPYEKQLKEGVIPGREMMEMQIDQKRTCPCDSAMGRTDALRQVMKVYPQFFDSSRYRVDDQTQMVLMCTQGDAYYTPVRTYYYASDNVSILRADNEEKNFRFKQNTTRMAADMIEALHLNPSRFQDFFRFRTYALLMHAFRAYSPELRKEALQDGRSWKALSGLRVNIVRLATSHPLIWRLALLLRKVIVG